LKATGKGDKIRYVPIHSIASDLIDEYLSKAGHGGNHGGALFRPFRDSRGVGRKKAITSDGVYKLVKKYSALLGFEIGVPALRATTATNALDHDADIAKVHEWLGHANMAITPIYDHRKTRPEDSPTFKISYRFEFSNSMETHFYGERNVKPILPRPLPCSILVK
jgi:integrase/recombinase XerD